MTWVVLSVLYQLNSILLKSRWIEDIIWQCIKMELFFVDGHCQNTGNCCRNIMIYTKNTPVDTRQKWEKIKDQPQYQRFYSNSVQNNVIHSFNCTCLTPSNRCSQYLSRPSFCKTYPMNVFFDAGVIPKSCGYFVNLKEKYQNITIKHAQLKFKVDQVKRLNNLDTVLKKRIDN